MSRLWTAEGLWAWGHAALLAVLVAALVAIVMLQGAARPPGRRSLRALHVVSAPLLALFVIVVVQRFRGLSG